MAYECCGFSQHEFVNSHLNWLFTYHHFAIKNPVTAFKHSVRRTISPYFLLAQSTFLFKEKVRPCNTEMPVINGYKYTCVQNFCIIHVLIKLNLKLLYISLKSITKHNFTFRESQIKPFIVV